MKGPSLRNYKQITVPIGLSKCHTIIITFIQKISGHHVDLCLKVTTQTQRRDKHLEDRAVMDRNKERTLLLNVP